MLFRTPLLAFIKIYGLTNSPLFYLLIAICAIIVYLAVHIRLNKKIIYTLPSYKSMAYVAIFGMIISLFTYLALNFNQSVAGLLLMFGLGDLAATFVLANGPLSLGGPLATNGHEQGSSATGSAQGSSATGSAQGTSATGSAQGSTETSS